MSDDDELRDKHGKEEEASVTRIIENILNNRTDISLPTIRHIITYMREPYVMLENERLRVENFMMRNHIVEQIDYVFNCWDLPTVAFSIYKLEELREVFRWNSRYDNDIIGRDYFERLFRTPYIIPEDGDGPLPTRDEFMREAELIRDEIADE